MTEHCVQNNEDDDTGTLLKHLIKGDVMRSSNFPSKSRDREWKWSLLHCGTSSNVSPLGSTVQVPCLCSDHLNAQETQTEVDTRNPRQQTLLSAFFTSLGVEGPYPFLVLITNGQLSSSSCPFPTDSPGPSPSCQHGRFNRKDLLSLGEI